MSFYGSRRRVGVFSAFASGAPAAGDSSSSSLTATWTPNWDQPDANTLANTPVGQVPYNIVDPSLVDINPDGTPYYLSGGERPLPDWVVPVAIAGTAAVVGLSALGFTLRKKRRR